MFDGDLLDCPFNLSVEDKRNIANLGKMELVIAEIALEYLEAALVISKSLEEAFSFEAKLAVPLAMGFSSFESFEIGKEAVVFVLQDFGIDIGEFRMLLLEIKKRMLKFTAVGAFLFLQTFEKLVVGEAALIQCPEQFLFLFFCGIEAKFVGANHQQEK